MCYTLAVFHNVSHFLVQCITVSRHLLVQYISLSRHVFVQCITVSRHVLVQCITVSRHVLVQCIRVDDWCDGKHTCRDGSDEGRMCKDSSHLGRNIILDFLPPPARVDFLDLGWKSPVSFSIQPLPASNGSKFWCLLPAQYGSVHR